MAETVPNRQIGLPNSSLNRLGAGGFRWVAGTRSLANTLVGSVYLDPSSVKIAE